MKNNSNIYDIDGELIRAFDDTHHWDVKETQEKIKYYEDKIKEVGENSEKAKVYMDYIRNLTKHVWTLYAKMTPEEFNAELQKAKTQDNLQEQVENAINDLKKDLENDGSTEESNNDEIPGTASGDTESSTDGELGNAETIERECSDVHEEGPTTQDSLLVERTDVNNSMDEYIDYEEV